jgi:probable phosphoglycerate mutase
VADVVCVRHAETPWSKAHRHTGRTDIGLTDAGRDAARALAPRLADWGFSRVLCSPLSRARETAELAGFGGRLELRDELQEWDYGAYEGITTEAVREGRPGWWLWRDGVPDGESPGDVAARCDAVVAELAAGDGDGGDVLVVAHGHLLRMLAARWVQAGPELGGRLRLDVGGVCVLGWEREVRALRRFNV